MDALTLGDSHFREAGSITYLFLSLWQNQNRLQAFQTFHHAKMPTIMG
jgi:hypothetical protein